MCADKASELVLESRANAAYENYPTELLIEAKLSEVQLQKQIV